MRACFLTLQKPGREYRIVSHQQPPAVGPRLSVELVDGDLCGGLSGSGVYLR